MKKTIVAILAVAFFAVMAIPSFAADCCGNTGNACIAKATAPAKCPFMGTSTPKKATKAPGKAIKAPAAKKGMGGCPYTSTATPKRTGKASKVSVVKTKGKAMSGCPFPASKKPGVRNGKACPTVGKAKPKKVVSAVCPVMGNKIPDITKAAGKSVYKGKTYYFCCPNCKPKFDKNPGKYIHK